MNDLSNWMDPVRSCCLCDVGADGFIAATAVGADGTEHLVLAARDSLGDETVVYNPDCPDVAHEGLGRLPRHIRERICGEDYLRCGRPRWDGQPCRQRVKEPGQSCSVHCDGHSCGKCRSCYLNNSGEVRS